MYDRRPKSNFRGLSLGERAEARDLLGEAGSRNEFWWLSAVNVTSLWQATEILNEIPAALWRLGFVSLFAQQNFDKLRMTGWVFVFGYAFVFGQPNGRMVIGFVTCVRPEARLLLVFSFSVFLYSHSQHFFA